MSFLTKCMSPPKVVVTYLHIQATITEVPDLSNLELVIGVLDNPGLQHFFCFRSFLLEITPPSLSPLSSSLLYWPNSYINFSLADPSSDASIAAVYAFPAMLEISAHMPRTLQAFEYYSSCMLFMAVGPAAPISLPYVHVDRPKC